MKSRLIWDQEAAGSIPACSTSGIAAPAPRVNMEDHKEGRGRVNAILLLALVCLQRFAARPLTFGLPVFTPVLCTLKIHHASRIPWYTAGFE